MSENEPAAAVPDWSSGVPLMAGEWPIGIYQPSPETVPYWEGVGRHELLLKRCTGCGAMHHPRRIVCSSCGDATMDWQQAAGGGRVYTFSDVHRPTDKAFAPSAPYTVGVVRLDEGVHFFGRIVAAGSAPVRIDDPVTVEFRVLELGLLLPIFVVEPS